MLSYPGRQVTSSYEKASQRIHRLLEAFLKMNKNSGDKQNNKLFVPRNHRLSSLDKPRDAKRRTSGRIFLSYPHTHERVLY